MPNYRRRRIAGGTYFFTLVLMNRNSRLLVEHVDALRGAFRHVRARHPFAIDAIVVLPDHLYCIWTLPNDDHDFSTRWRLIIGRLIGRIHRFTGTSSTGFIRRHGVHTM